MKRLWLLFALVMIALVAFMSAPQVSACDQFGASVQSFGGFSAVAVQPFAVPVQTFAVSPFQVNAFAVAPVVNQRTVVRTRVFRPFFAPRVRTSVAVQSFGF